MGNTAQVVRSVTITTDAEGDGSATIPNIYGIVHAVGIVQNTLTSGFDLSVTDALTGVALFTITNVSADGIWQSRVGLFDAAGAAITGAYDAPVAFGGIEIAIVDGGSAKSGTVYVMTDQ